MSDLRCPWCEAESYRHNDTLSVAECGTRLSQCPDGLWARRSPECGELGGPPLQAKLAAAEREVRVLRDAIQVALDEHPYPVDIFPATVEDYVALIPDPQDRTAISGVVGRIGYDACLARIEQYIAENEEESDE